MSKVRQSSCVVEWRPGKVIAFNRRSETLVKGTGFSEIASSCDKGATILSLGRTVCFLRMATLPDAPKIELEKIVRNTIAKDFPLPPGQAAIDFYISNQKTPNGRLVIVFAVSAQHLEAIRKEAADSGFSVAAIQPAALGTQLLAAQNRIENGVLFSQEVDGIAIDVIKDGLIHYTRVVKPGGDLEAEKLRTLAAAGLSDQAESFTSYSCDNIHEEMVQVSTSPIYAQAHEDVAATSVNIELQSEKEEQEKAAKRSAITFASVAFAVAAVFGLYVAQHIYSSRSAVSAAIAVTKSKTTALKTAESKISSRQSDLNKPFSVIDRGFNPAQRMSDMLVSIGADVPPGLWLTSITIERGKAIVLRGTAKDSQQVNAFVQQLSADSRFRDVKLSFANSGQVGQVTVTQFSLTAFPIGNLPLTDKQGSTS